jgi:hypothetical protein
MASHLAIVQVYKNEALIQVGNRPHIGPLFVVDSLLK